MLREVNLSKREGLSRLPLPQPSLLPFAGLGVKETDAGACDVVSGSIFNLSAVQS